MHLVRLACSRALLSAGNRIEISNAMMPITTNNSTRVKPRPFASFLDRLHEVLNTCSSVYDMPKP